MQLIEYLDLYVGALINYMFYIIIIKYIFNVKTNKNKLKSLLILFIVPIFIAIINIYNKDLFKLLLTIPFVTMGTSFILDIKFPEAFIGVLASTFYMFIGELLAFLLLNVLDVNYVYIISNMLGTLVGNILAIIMTIPLLFICKLRQLIQNFSKINNSNTFTIISLLFLGVVGALGYRNAHNVQNNEALIVNIILILMFCIICYFLYNQYLRATNFSDNYNSLLKYLEKYEKELDEKRKLIHNYKNQLIVINGYADKNNKKLKQYISEIIEEQKTITDNGLMKNLDKLPKGLRGLIYYKFSQLDNSFKININVKNNINSFSSISSKMNNEILKIIGILIDNAIEAASLVKQKQIDLEIFEENNIIKMNLINNCTNMVDKDKIIESGYSTKGKNRGYGLSIVNNIIKNNEKLEIDIISNNHMFIVNLKIKL